MQINTDRHEKTKAKTGPTTTGKKRTQIARVPDLCCRDGLGPLHGFPGRPVPPDSGRIQSGILCCLGGPETSGEGGVRGVDSGAHRWKTKQDVLEPDLVMLLQPPASPAAPRPPSARHVTARERQETAEEFRWKSADSQPRNRPGSSVWPCSAGVNFNQF